MLDAACVYGEQGALFGQKRLASFPDEARVQGQAVSLRQERDARFGAFGLAAEVRTINSLGNL
jgi:hypothetical protein